MSRDSLVGLFILAACVVCMTVAHGGHDDIEPDSERDDTPEDEVIDAETLEYQKGSLCGYCDYCKFCKLCDADCPCEQAPSRPNCHMCKYCRYCYVCKVCDSVCQPGGIIDRVTSKLFNSLPNINREEVNADIEGVKTWIDKKKDEL